MPWPGTPTSRMEVDRDVFDKVLFYRRGEATRRAEMRSWFGLRRKTIEYISDAKVLIFVTFKEADHLLADGPEQLPFVPGSTIIKLFEDAPRNDLEMLFPHVEPRMRVVGKLMIGVPAVVSGVVIVVTKLISSFGVLLLVVGFWTGLREHPVEIDQTALIALGVGLFSAVAAVADCPRTASGSTTGALARMLYHMVHLISNTRATSR